MIRPGVSIGKLRLGMPEAAARKAYPYPFAKREARPFGRQYVRMSFGLSPYSAVLYGPKGRTRVVSVYTLSARERTPEGVGIGTTEARMREVYGARLQCDPPHEYVRDGVTLYNRSRPCSLQGRRAETSFGLVMDPGQPGSGTVLRWEPEKAVVTGVSVRTLPQPR